LAAFRQLVRFDQFTSATSSAISDAFQNIQFVGLHARALPVAQCARDVNFEHIKRHYYESHESVNPTRIVPMGPLLDFEHHMVEGPLDVNQETRWDGPAEDYSALRASPFGR